MKTFRSELETIINKYSVDNTINTPDFVLVKFIVDSLEAFNNATILRDKWHGEHMMSVCRDTDV